MNESIIANTLRISIAVLLVGYLGFNSAIPHQATTYVEPPAITAETPTILSHKEVQAWRTQRLAEVENLLRSTDLSTDHQKLAARTIVQLEEVVPHCSFTVTTNTNDENENDTYYSTRVTVDENGFSEQRLEENSTDSGNNSIERYSSNIANSYTEGYTNMWDLSSIRVKENNGTQTVFAIDFDVDKISQVFLSVESENGDSGDWVSNRMTKSIEKIFSRLEYEVTASKGQHSPVTLRFHLTKPTNIIFGVKLRSLKFEKRLEYDPGLQEFFLHKQEFEIRARAFFFWGVREKQQMWYSDYDCGVPLTYVKLEKPEVFLQY